MLPSSASSRSRKGSFASVSSRGPLDKEALSQVLDDIHSTASKSEAFVSFSDFDAHGSSRVSGAKELVSGSLSNLYTRFRQSVSAASPTIPQARTRSTERNVSHGVIVPSRSLSSLSGAAATYTTDSVDTLQLDPAITTPVSSRGRESEPVQSHDTNSTADALNDALRASSLPRNSVANEAAAAKRPARSKTATPEVASTTSISQRRPDAAELTWHALHDNDLPNVPNNVQAEHTFTTDQPHGAQRDGQSNLKTQDEAATMSPTAKAERSTDTHGSIPTDFAAAALTQPAPKLALPRISEKAPPTVNISRSNSATDPADLLLHNSSTVLAPKETVMTPKLPGRKATQKPSNSHLKPNAIVPAHIKRRVVSKEFWMKDENARDCFYCGDTFSAFRRKHHCRTCGQIFDAKCTLLVSGRPFDLPGTLRLCNPCEAVIYGSEDDSTDASDTEDLRRSTHTDRLRTPRLKTEGLHGSYAPFKPEDAVLATPSIGIPASRRTRQSKGGSAVIEFATQLPLARPDSSRSLKSMNGRVGGAANRRQPTRHVHARSLRTLAEEQGPFHQNLAQPDGRQLLPAFHNDNVIDPDLAPFMSDEESDDGPSIFAVLNQAPPQSSILEAERAGFSNHGSSRKSASRGPSRQNSKLRRRNTSIASMNFPRPSPRRSRSQNLSESGIEGIMQEDLDHSGSHHSDVSGDATESVVETRSIRGDAMYGLATPKIELNRASLEHVRGLLSQILQDSPNVRWRAWQKALLPILLQCTDEVDPNVQSGDDMDVRNYIKFKKISGGRPTDTSYMSGVVFSKNIALKGMKRNLVDCRILIVTFALEYARHHQHFISLEPVIAQEREYLRNLVGRISALKPDVLLVQRNVSGVALQMLQEANITVIYNVKETVLAAVARVTRTIMVKSVDKLSMDPSQLGRCQSFDVRTFVHLGSRKNYIYIAGCDPSLGCTIILRGARIETLRQIKRITEFMCYVVYNLRLETSLLRDEFVLLPTVEHASSLISDPSLALPDTSADTIAETVQEAGHLIGHDHSIEAVRPGHSTPDRDGTASNATVSKTVPSAATDSPRPFQYNELLTSARTRLLSSSPFVKFVEPYLLLQAHEQELRVLEYKRRRDMCLVPPSTDSALGLSEKDILFEMLLPEHLDAPSPPDRSNAMMRVLYEVYNVQYQRALKEYEAKKKQWQSFYQGSNNNPFDPFTHQNIFVLQSLVSTLTSAPCAGPEVIGLSFYAAYEQTEMNYEDDCTLGQYVEDICLGATTSCKTCDKRMFDHHRQYVHGAGQLSVSVTPYPSRIKGLSSSILMWSTCKLCNQETTVMPMSESTWRYSFGKYLELSFWSTPLKPRAGLCPHDVHKDFVRCFGFHDHCVRVQFDKTELYDVLVPSAMIDWAVTADLELKNQLFGECVAKLNAFIDSIRARLNTINLESVTPEKTPDASVALEQMRNKASADYAMSLDQLQSKYMHSHFYEVVPLNQAIRALEEKAVLWDEDFANFERDYFPSENDIRRLATLQLKKLFLDRSENASDQSDSDDAVEMKARSSVKSPPDGQITLSEKAETMLTAAVGDSELSSPLSMQSISLAQKLNVHVAGADAPLSRQLSPQETEQAIKGAGVQHLDLAVIIPHLEVSPPTEDSNGSAALMSESRKEIEVLVEEPKPLEPELVERIEHMTSATNESENEKDASDDHAPESRIPRPASTSPGAGLAVPPPLARTQSQPDGVIPILASSSSASSTNVAGEGQPRESLLVEIGRVVEQKLLDKFGPGKLAKISGSLIPRSVPSSLMDSSTRVSALAKHFEQLSLDFEKERLRERRMRTARTRRHRANQGMSSEPVVKVYRDASEAIETRAQDAQRRSSRPSNRRRSQSTHIANVDRRAYAQAQIQDYYERHETTDHDSTDNDAFDEAHDPDMSDIDAHEDADAESDTGETRVSSELAEITTGSGPSTSILISPSSAGLTEAELALPRHEKSSLMKMLSSFWSERSASGWAPLEYPLYQTEHVFDDSDIIVREDEPSSVIALTLSSKDYLKKLDEFRRDTQDAESPAHSKQDAILESLLVSEVGTHMKYSFGHNHVRAQCKIFFAESFDALRRKCGVSERFVESLSRSIKWDSKGGKTKSLFLKTLDDRFVIKSLQEVELKAFTRCAPDYFAFMAHSLFHGVPSVIAKMFGVFQVVVKNTATGVDFNSYLLVMENLFYDRKPTRRFDLKGSMRNRKIESTGQPDEVLLDENLVETIFETPLFVREHARKLVKASVWNDTMWLCKQNVMDYSLMAGFDDTARTLTIGIIDCIRTYTWDKKLESWIKDRGKNKPTITSPKDYRNRFRVSMLQYVLQAPNVYHEFSKQVTAPTSLKVTEQTQTALLDIAIGAGQADADADESAAPTRRGSIGQAMQSDETLGFDLQNDGQSLEARLEVVKTPGKITPSDGKSQDEDYFTRR